MSGYFASLPRYVGGTAKRGGCDKVLVQKLPPVPSGAVLTRIDEGLRQCHVDLYGLRARVFRASVAQSVLGGFGLRGRRLANRWKK
jgi:hypothetical protein